jgi:hypothetical protein
MAIPNIRTELKRIGYIMTPPFSKRERSSHEFTEPGSAAKASPGNPNKFNSTILIVRCMIIAISKKSYL